MIAHDKKIMNSDAQTMCTWNTTNTWPFVHHWIYPHEMWTINWTLADGVLEKDVQY